MLAEGGARGSRRFVALLFGSKLKRSAQQIDDFFIRNLRKVRVKLPDSIEWLRCPDANQFVDLPDEAIARPPRRDWRGDNNRCRPQLSNRVNRRKQTGSCGNSVIDQQHCSTTNGEFGTIAAIEPLAAMQLFAFRLRNGGDFQLGELEVIHDGGVQNADAPASDRSERQFIMAWHSQFTQNENVHGNLEEGSYLKGDDNAATRNSKNNDVISVCEPRETGSELSACVSSISEQHVSTSGLRNNWPFVLPPAL